MKYALKKSIRLALAVITSGIAVGAMSQVAVASHTMGEQRAMTSSETMAPSVSVTLRDNTGEDAYYIETLTATERTLIRGTQDLLELFRGRDSGTIRDEGCEIDLSKGYVKTSCWADNGVVEISVEQQQARGEHYECNSSSEDNPGGCNAFIAACNYLGGGLGSVDGGGISCDL